MVTPEVMMRTSRQTKAYLLCDDCEDVLNRGGETWIVPLLATANDTFPLYDIISKTAPDLDEPDMKAYAASRNAEVAVDKIVHFAAGIFWKSSVHSWSCTQRESLIDLGPYSNDLRAFLLGKELFPAAMTLHVLALPPPVRIISTHLPIKAKSSGFRGYCLYVPGIDFRLCVGKKIPDELRRTCIYHSPLHPIVVAEYAQRELANDMVAALSSTRRRARKLAEWFNGLQ